MWSFHEEITFQCLIYANTNNNMIKDDSVFQNTQLNKEVHKLTNHSIFSSTPRSQIEKLRKINFVVNFEWKGKWLNLMGVVSLSDLHLCVGHCVIYVWLDESVRETQRNPHVKGPSPSGSFNYGITMEAENRASTLPFSWLRVFSRKRGRVKKKLNKRLFNK